MYIKNNWAVPSAFRTSRAHLPDLMSTIIVRYSYVPKASCRSDLCDRLVQRVAMIPERGFVSQCLSR